MVIALAVLVVTLLPFVAVAALLRVSDHLEARQRARYARQIALTDTIHRELGAVAAPTVSRRLGRGWRVAMAVPFDRPATLAALVEVVDRATAAWEEPKARRVEILLTPAWAPAHPAVRGAPTTASAPSVVGATSLIPMSR